MKKLIILACVAILGISNISCYFIGKNSVEDNLEPVTSASEIATTSVVATTEGPTTIPYEDIVHYKELGIFELTAYCPCEKCCGKSDGITATGTKATEGRTIAVDPDVIPYGTEVMINGKTYIAEDCGGAIKDNVIDIYFDSHQDALEFGRKLAKVFIEEV